MTQRLDIYQTYLNEGAKILINNDYEMFKTLYNYYDSDMFDNNTKTNEQDN